MSYPFETRSVELAKGDHPSWGIGLVSCDGIHGPAPASGYSVEVTEDEANASRHDVHTGEFIVSVNGVDLAQLGMGDDNHGQYDYFTAEDGPATGTTLSLVLATREVLESYVPSEADNKAEEDVNQSAEELQPEEPKATETAETAETAAAVAVYSTVPYTTRARREGERDGREYNFITRQQFEKMIKDQKMVEWGEKNGTLYGTEKAPDTANAATAQSDSPRRQTMKVALAHGPDAVTIEHLLGPEKAGEHSAMEVHEFLAKHGIDHPVHGEKVKAVKTLVYDISIPFTTRPRREGEMEGREYHFVSKETFTNMAEAGAFMEYGFKGSHAYGTSKLTQQLVDAHKKKLRTTTKDALASSHPEASVAAILGTTGAKKTGSDIAASRFLASVDPEHPELADIRNQIKVAIYDITVPLTTREPRSGERNGIDYNFVSAETFQLYIDSDQMLEWGEKKGMFYGTLKVTDKDVENAKGRVDNRRKTYKETVNVHPSEQPSASPTAAYQTVDGAEWHETLV